MTKNDLRLTIIDLLREAGKAPAEVDTALIAKGLAPLTADEIATLFKPLTAADILSATPNDAATKAEESAVAKVTASADVDEKPAVAPKKPESCWKLPGTEFVVTGKLATVAGKTNTGKTVVVAQAMANDFCHNVVDICKAAFGPAWYQQYRAIKYPGGVEAAATTETKMKAYAFAFEMVLKLKLSVHID